MATFMNFLGNNSYTVEAAEAEKKLRSKEPKLLHEGESLELAFKSAFDPRDKSYLTSHRILIKDGKGISGKRKNFKSIPYSSIQAYSVKTAGGAFDGDTELRVWSSGFGCTKIEFGKGEVDLFAVQQFFNAKVMKSFLPEGAQDITASQPVSTSSASSLGSILDWIGEDACQLDAPSVETKLKQEYPVLVSDEKIELAFKCGRDFTVFTDKRFMIVDVQGFLGKSIEFQSFSWQCIKGFSVESAGGFLDSDAEMRLFTNIDGFQRIEQDFRKTKVDLWAVKKCISNKVLGKDDSPLPDIDKRQGHIDKKSSWWGRDNNRPLDAVEMNRVFHESPPILQSQEVVEMAFKGIRDIILFTTKRVLKVDPQGWSGKSVEYTSIPWKSIIGFGAKTAGKHLDNDSEIMLWTEMMFKHNPGEDKEDEPYMAMWELDFNKKMVDIIAVKKYISTRCLNATGDVTASVTAIRPDVSVTSREETGFARFLSAIGNDQHAIDPIEMDRVMHTDLPILLDNENVIMAFKAGRDMSLFTNMRILIVDVQGWSGKKVEYKSLPYKHIRAFSVESAGGWDRDSEVELFTKNKWNLAQLPMDFRQGKVDIVVIQKFLSAMCLGTKADQELYAQSSASASLPSSHAVDLNGAHIFACHCIPASFLSGLPERA